MRGHCPTERGLRLLRLTRPQCLRPKRPFQDRGCYWRPQEVGGSYCGAETGECERGRRGGRATHRDMHLSTNI